MLPSFDGSFNAGLERMSTLIRLKTGTSSVA
jgi:hypothetical protein